MTEIVDVDTLRRDMGRILARVVRGERFTVLHLGRPVCRLEPIGAEVPEGRAEDDALYGMGPVGRSTDGWTGADHDAVLDP